MVKAVRSDWDNHADRRIEGSGAADKFELPLRSTDPLRPRQNLPSEQTVGLVTPFGASTFSRSVSKSASPDSLLSSAFEMSDSWLVCWQQPAEFVSLVSIAIDEMLRPPIFVS